MPSAVDFDGAGAGICLVWHLSYTGNISGLEPGMNANNLIGCYSLSNSVEVIRTVEGDCQANGGTLFGGPFEFTVGDGIADTIATGAIVVTNSQADTMQWIVTDDQGIILGLPPVPSVVNFDGAGAGVCYIWNLSYSGAITGLEMGMNANDIIGCAHLSSPIEVIRTADGDCQANGGTLFGGPFEFCAGDGVADNIPAGSIVTANSQGMNTQWIVTDDQGMILGLPPMPSVVDFDGAGVGTCLVWHLAYDGNITGLAMGMNANNLQGCFSLSNAITVDRISCGTTETSDIVINELDEQGRVEIKNIGNNSVDISSYWLCNFPSYDRVGTLTINCGGDYILDPGELVTVEVNFSISGNDGEMGLYTTNSFSSAAALIDYVEWGNSGHQRSGVAVQAGIWTSNDAATSFSNTQSLAYDGSGDASTDWTLSTFSPCVDNIQGPTTTNERLNAIAYPNPAVESVSVKVVGGLTIAEPITVYVYDQLGIMVMERSYQGQADYNLDINTLSPGNYTVKILHARQSSILRFIKI